MLVKKTGIFLWPRRLAGAAVSRPVQDGTWPDFRQRGRATAAAGAPHLLDWESGRRYKEAQLSQSSQYSGKGKGSPRQAAQQVKAYQTGKGRSMGDAQTGAGMTTQAGAGARQAPLSDKDAGSAVWDKGNASTGKGMQGKR